MTLKTITCAEGAARVQMSNTYCPRGETLTIRVAIVTAAGAAILLLSACASLPAACQFTCISPGHAVTAGHCIGQRDPAVLVPAPSCESTPTKRRAEPGELATVGTRTLIVVGHWLGHVVLEGPCLPGESGSGVYGADQALLGVVIENHSDQCYADTLER